MSNEQRVKNLALCWIELFVLIALVVTYGWATYQRNFVWKDEVTFWSYVIKKSPDKARPYNNLGRAYLTDKAFPQAIHYFKEALRLNPYFSYAHYNLGISYQGVGLYDEAITEYQKALYGTRQPYFAKTHNNIGVCYFIKGWTDMAIEEFNKAIEINPYFSDAHFNLGIAYRSKGLYALADEQIKKAEGLEKGK
jgi:tetratricopeptide (TPR) repeat protein